MIGIVAWGGGFGFSGVCQYVAILSTYHRLDCRVAASNLNGAVGSVLSKWLVINWKCSSSIFLWSSFVFVLVGTLAVFLLKDIIKY